MLARRELVSNPGHPGCNPRDRFDRLAHLFRNPVWRQRLSANFQDVIPQTGKTGSDHFSLNDGGNCGVKPALDSCFSTKMT